MPNFLEPWNLPLEWSASSAWVACIFRLGWFASSAQVVGIFRFRWFASAAWGILLPLNIPFWGDMVSVFVYFRISLCFGKCGSEISKRNHKRVLGGARTNQTEMEFQHLINPGNQVLQCLENRIHPPLMQNR